MAYTKQTILTGDLITADWGNYIQTQYDEAKADLDTKLDGTTGHRHGGTSGDGPKIPDSNIDPTPTAEATGNTIVKRDANGKTALAGLTFAGKEVRIYKYGSTLSKLRELACTTASPKGLAWLDNFLWYVDPGDDKIRKVDPMDGSVEATINAPNSNCNGMTTDGTYLWVSDTVSGYTYKINTSGTVQSSFSGGYNGLTWDGNYLWAIRQSGINAYLEKLNTSGTVLQSNACTPKGDLTYIPCSGTFWAADDETDKIYEINQSGTTLRSIAAQSTQPYGMAFDGFDVWHSDFNADKFYVLDLVQKELLAL